MVQGLKSLRRKLTKSIPEHVRRAAADTMEKQVEIIVSIMRRRVPKDEGDLEASIGWTWGDAPAGALIVGTVGDRSYGALRITIFAGNSDTIVTNSRGIEFQNAILQEFGTKDMPPTPYFYPTWREKRRGAKSSITRAVNKAIKTGAR